MVVSIIIVNYRTWRFLEACLAALLADGPPDAAPLEIIVVDNDSSDGELPKFIERFPTVRFYSNSGNHGFAHGNNLGAHHAGGELLLFLNPDMVAERGQIERLIDEKRRHAEISILSARQVDDSGRPQRAFDSFPTAFNAFSAVRFLQRRLRPASHPDPRAPHDTLVSCDWVSGSLLLIGEEDFRTLGGWSEDFWMYLEDTDLCFRARAAGMRTAWTPHAEFLHRHGGASRRDPATAALAKTETIISKHVYIHRHRTGLRAAAFHATVAIKEMLPVAALSALDWITLRSSPSLRVRSGMLRRLLAYYRGVRASGCWLSPRSVLNPSQSDGL